MIKRLLSPFLPLALFPFLGSSAVFAATPSASQLLARSGEFVTDFVRQFSDVTCTEAVLQQKLRPNGKLEHKENSAFDLLVMINPGSGALAIEESRLPQGSAPRPDNKYPLLLTNGFSTLLLILHPQYQASFEFSEIEAEEGGGPRSVKLHFEHIRGTPSPTALVLRGREYPLELAGTAWIDPESGAVLRISTSLGSSMVDLGVRSIQSDVSYVPVTLAGQKLWLPSSATIDVETPRQHWRNVHTFSRYKTFSVGANDTTGPKP